MMDMGVPHGPQEQTYDLLTGNSYLSLRLTNRLIDKKINKIYFKTSNLSSCIQFPLFVFLP